LYFPQLLPQAIENVYTYPGLKKCVKLALLVQKHVWYLSNNQFTQGIKFADLRAGLARRAKQDR
jgi:hypothetical protein